MLPHVKNYFNHFGYGIDDVILCEVCGSKSVDLHHIERRMKGVKRLDDVENIIALCRNCHDKAHSGLLLKVDLQTIHKLKIAEKYFYK